MKKILLAGLTTSLLMLGITGWANADDIHLSYEVTPNPSSSFVGDIYDVVIYNTYQNGGGALWAANFSSGGSTYNDPFVKSSNNIPLTGLMLGLVDDSNSFTHLVIMSSTGVDSSAVDFSTFAESVIIADLKRAIGTANIGDLNVPGSDPGWESAFNDLLSFVNDSNSNIWFNMPDAIAGQTHTKDFKVMQWSDGQDVGTGKVTLTYDTPQAAPVPEPATMLLFGTGIVGLAAVGRRKRS